MPVPDKVRDLIARIDAVVGMAGAIGGYRRDVPDERQEAQYTELATGIEDDLTQLREETGAGLVNDGINLVIFDRDAPVSNVGDPEIRELKDPAQDIPSFSDDDI